MKILYLTHTITWKGGGIFYTAFHQGRYLARRGHEVTLLSISPSSRFSFSETTVEGVRIVETPDLLHGLARTGWDLWDILCRIWFLKDKKFDIIHGFESRPVVSLPALFMRKKWKTPLIMTWADLFGKGGRSEERSFPIRFFMSPVEDFCEKYFYPKADFVIAMGEPLLKKALETGIPAGKMLSLLHGSDIERTKAIPQDIAVQRLGSKLPKQTVILGYLGYLWTVNADLLFQTFRLVKESLDKPIKLLLIGNHRVNLNKILPDDLTNDILETGWADYEDVNLYLCASDVLILPLKRTQVSDIIWPSKLNDYLASGRPVVATKMQIVESIHQKKDFGYLTEDTPQSLSQAVLSMLSADPSQVEKYGRNARSLAEVDLAWGAIVTKLESLYLQLIVNR